MDGPSNVSPEPYGTEFPLQYLGIDFDLEAVNSSRTGAFPLVNIKNRVTIPVFQTKVTAPDLHAT